MNIFDYAVQMEVDGENFYRKQASRNKNSKLNKVFMSLAEDEKKHAEIIKEKLAGKDFLLNEANIETDKNVFSDATGLDYEKGFTNQSDVYEKALEMEEKSINLYKNLLTKSVDDKDIFEFLIKQEEEHYRIIEEISIMVNRPNEWVESAEFGMRVEKY
jgi:rubrerythrin